MAPDITFNTYRKKILSRFADSNQEILIWKRGRWSFGRSDVSNCDSLKNLFNFGLSFGFILVFDLVLCIQ